MPWATNPIFTARSPTEKVTTDAEAAQAATGNGDKASGTSLDPPPVKDDDSGFRPPTDKFTVHQFFYIFIIDGIGAAFVSGGINFAIAFALYHNKGSNESPIRLFQFPNTLAGDTAVTIFVQFLITWIIESILVNHDLKKGGVQPIGFIQEPEWKVLRWFMFLDRQEQTHEVRSFKHWLEYLFSQAIRSLILAVAFFPLIFGVSIGLLTLAGTRKAADWDWYYSAKWAPEIFKLVQGAVLGLLFTPPMVIFWLARCGWALRKNEGQSE
ncbi:hypothetical protein HD806DRAFT_62771 [Xylariaceae sp. AK1471]|nr:hypothetical protein HD806DRAFT_62771 [Xylariaceae sp. AK1471]